MILGPQIAKFSDTTLQELPGASVESAQIVEISECQHNVNTVRVRGRTSKLISLRRHSLHCKSIFCLQIPSDDTIVLVAVLHLSQIRQLFYKLLTLALELLSSHQGRLQLSSEKLPIASSSTKNPPNYTIASSPFLNMAEDGHRNSTSKILIKLASCLNL